MGKRSRRGCALHTLRAVNMPYQYSDVLDDELLYERVPSFGGGMDGFTTASELAQNTNQYNENCILAGNKRLRTRPGADSLAAGPVNAASVIQGLLYFDTPTYEQLLAANGSKIMKWDGAAWTQAAGWAPQDQRTEMAQGVDKVLLTDGQGNMQSWDGVNFADLGAVGGTVSSSPPVGATILCWHTSRMFAAGKGGSPDTLWASFLLDITKWNHTQFSLRVGGGEGEPITGLCSLQNYQLVVFKENSVYLVVADPSQPTAANWQIFPLSRAIGCVGRKAFCVYGNESLFMARDGVRSVRRMVAASGQYELTAPISEPMQPYIDRINWAHADLIAARNYKELVLFSVPLDASLTNNAVLVYNARLGVWLGLWTGWTPACWEVTRFNGVLRLVHGDQAGLARQYKDFRDAGDDATYLDDAVAIPTKGWLRSMLFGEPENDKDGYHAEARFNTSNAIVNITAVGDEADLRTWSEDVRQKGPDLPLDLPFDLGSLASVPTRRGLRGLKPFNEIYLKIESTAGWWELRNVTVSAYLNTLANQ